MTAPGRHRIAELPIGRRVAQLRARRGLTQQVFADRIGKSHSWVDKVERGIRSLDRISVVHTVAAVLGVTPEVILGPTTSRPEPTTNTPAAVEHLRAALARYDNPTPDQPSSSAEDLHHRIQYAHSAYQHAHYPQLLRMLPDLLTHTRHFATGPNPVDEHLLTRVYRLTAHLLTKLDEPHLAWLAAGRAISTANHHPRHTAAAAIALTQALRALHRSTLAIQAALTAVPLIDPAATDDPAPGDHALTGTLLIEAALAAATGNDPATAHELTDRAGKLAATMSHRQRRPDDSGTPTTAFGPTAVALARAQVAAALGNPHQAITHHQCATASHGWRELPAEHRAAHLIDITRAYLDIGDHRAAGRAMVAADQIAPAETRTRPIGHTALAAVLRAGPTPADVARLAATVGLIRH
ncbi:helix-turn-helix domain-containing protein [Micromonospora sp. NBC_01813]|uniref:helix-turn-helix domain-containing protein n=1 Tax=Micromonospora sp. NBC_01813 TaxID=2975988 RepID=UPI002DD7F758|nr:helix-turn-helix domain-containing protein [Micromonospora sp. NBC_01813]WSA10881.1 helix-turn-helix domain-containing protein [Micromonospora sp. NBC_01813]